MVVTPSRKPKLSSLVKNGFAAESGLKFVGSRGQIASRSPETPTFDDAEPADFDPLAARITDSTNR
jgi:hypothetical protein